MNSAISNQTEIVKLAKANFFLAKAAVVNGRDLTSDESTTALDNLFAARNLFIEQAIAYAQLSPKCTAQHKAILNTLKERASKSPAIREQLLNQLLAIKL